MEFLWLIVIVVLIVIFLKFLEANGAERQKRFEEKQNYYDPIHLQKEVLEADSIIVKWLQQDEEATEEVWESVAMLVTVSLTYPSQNVRLLSPDESHRHLSQAFKKLGFPNLAEGVLDHSKGPNIWGTGIVTNEMRLDPNLTSEQIPGWAANEESNLLWSENIIYGNAYVFCFQRCKAIQLRHGWK